jgi:PhzF family phenazine biosynthesis protein
MGLPLFQVDAFTEKRFTGNPAAVCILDEPKPDKWLAQVAAEMNLSETAFLLRGEDGFELRWFTPTIEVDLCGHATLASAHALWEGGYLKPGQQARFHTRSGLLTAELRDGWIFMDFPALRAEAASANPPLLKALGTEPKWLGRNRLDYLVELASDETVRNLTPDIRGLTELGIRGVIVTAKPNTPPYDFISRFFAPGAGINEDPVTGSAHCCLGPYWQERLGKSEFLAYQASPRGGIVKVKCAGSRVQLGGRAVTVLRGDLV